MIFKSKTIFLILGFMILGIGMTCSILGGFVFMIEVGPKMLASRLPVKRPGPI